MNYVAQCINKIESIYGTKTFSKKDIQGSVAVHAADPGDPESIQILVGMVEKYFGPKINQKAKKNSDFWVTNVVSEFKSSPHIINAYVETGHTNRIIATDGHRMHYCRTKIEHEGFVHPLTLEPVECDLQFPPYDQVVPKSFEHVKENVRLTDFETVEKEQVEFEGILFNKKYVMDAFTGSETMTVSFSGPLDPVQFTEGYKLAIVMPQRR